MISVRLIDSMGSDLTTVNAARVSYSKEKEVFDDSDRKLIDYLGKHKHYSPFGHCFASFQVRAPVFVARQLVKHKFLRWNEESRRYINDDPEFYKPPSWRSKPTNSKQGSGPEAASQYFPNLYLEDTNKECLERYRKMIGQGIAPEQARMILPQTMMTSWYWSGSLDAFAEMCHLRCQSDTQLETQQVAVHIAKHMCDLFPKSWQGYLQWK